MFLSMMQLAAFLLLAKFIMETAVSLDTTRFAMATGFLSTILGILIGRKLK